MLLIMVEIFWKKFGHNAVKSVAPVCCGLLAFKYITTERLQAGQTNVVRD